MGWYYMKKSQGIRPRVWQTTHFCKGEIEEEKARGRKRSRRGEKEDEEVGGELSNTTGWCETIQMKWDVGGVVEGV